MSNQHFYGDYIWQFLLAARPRIFWGNTSEWMKFHKLCFCIECFGNVTVIEIFAPPADLFFLFVRCVNCSDCGATTPGMGCQWMSNYTQCGPCASKTTCPVCKIKYNTNDLMIQCSHCERYVPDLLKGCYHIHFMLIRIICQFLCGSRHYWCKLSWYWTCCFRDKLRILPRKYFCEPWLPWQKHDKLHAPWWHRKTLIP